MIPDIIRTLLPAPLAFIMFAVGVTLVPSDFSRLFLEPRAVIVGLIGQLLLLQVFAWGLAGALALRTSSAGRPLFR